ncbi:hypothetical protein MWH25_02375 [Natroniella acetigena]|uniref:hypothetical protein n=1 Tax=Natroniella acetigena TaxID=52004 RepID=UPI00200B6820|nr:hypothetical protein [Natroniella acetigena]MCK8826595.1 hypothetical protein [Natroniella acetigena]
MVYKYLFFKADNKIMVCQQRDDRLELVKYKGEDYYLGNLDSFWEWWEKTSSFLAMKHKVDFLILVDDSSFEFEKEYSPVAESSWSLKEVKEFFAQYAPYSKIELRQGESSYKLSIKFEKLADKYRDKVDNILYISTFPNKKLLSHIEQSDEEEVKGGELSPLARYYREKNREYKN